MDSETIKTIIEVGVVPALTALITWLLSRRKRLADVEQAELANEEKAITIYKNLCDELKGEIDELRHRVRENDKRINQLVQENCTLQLEMQQLKLNHWGDK